MNELFLAYWSKTLNMDNDRLAELLYKKADDGTLTDQISESALTALLEADAVRVKSLREGADSKEPSTTATKRARKSRSKILKRRFAPITKPRAQPKAPTL